MQSALYQRTGQDLSDRDTRNTSKIQCRGQTDMEADAYAAYVPNARICDP